MPDKRAELRGRIREKPGLWRYLRITSSGLLRVDKAKIAAEPALDGKTLLRTSEMDLDAAEIARGYKALLEVERGWRDLKQLELRPVYHRKDDRIIAHVQLSWLALLLIRTAEIACRRHLAQPRRRARPDPAPHLRHRPRHRVPTHPAHRQTIFHS
jgi:transposase